MKRLLFVALAALAFVSSAVHAQSTATSTFKVNLTLVPKCYVNMTATPSDAATTDVSLTYTAFQATDATASTGFTVTCTNTYPYTIAVAADSSAVAGINYYLTLVAGSTASYNNTAGNASLASQVGNGSAKAYTVGVSAPKSQAGTCTSATGNCIGSNTHTITVSY